MEAKPQKLFNTELQLFGREYGLEVFVMPKPDRTNFFRCVLDEIKVIDLWITDNGEWIDMENGTTGNAAVLGNLIEEKLALAPSSIKVTA